VLFDRIGAATAAPAGGVSGRGLPSSR